MRPEAPVGGTFWRPEGAIGFLTFVGVTGAIFEEDGTPVAGTIRAEDAADGPGAPATGLAPRGGAGLAPACGVSFPDVDEGTLGAAAGAGDAGLAVGAAGLAAAGAAGFNAGAGAFAAGAAGFRAGTAGLAAAGAAGLAAGTPGLGAATGALAAGAAAGLAGAGEPLKLTFNPTGLAGPPAPGLGGIPEGVVAMLRTASSHCV